MLPGSVCNKFMTKEEKTFCSSFLFIPLTPAIPRWATEQCGYKPAMGYPDKK
jgi:hypothetical protein